MESRTSDLLQEWEKEKPISGALRPDAALKNLTIFEGKFGRLKEERDNVSKAKEALELQDSGVYSASDERVAVGIEELQVWILEGTARWGKWTTSVVSQRWPKNAWYS